MSRFSTYERIIFTIIAIVILAAVGLVARTFISPATHIEAEVFIEKDAEAIWPYLVDSEKRVRWQTGIRDVIPLVGDTVMLGFRAIVLKRIGGDFWEVEEEVVDLIDQEQILVSHVVAQYSATIESTLMPTDSGTILRVKEIKNYTQFSDRLMAPWTQYQEQAALEKALAVLKELILSEQNRAPNQEDAEGA